MVEFLHKTFSPTYTGNLDTICKIVEKEGWELVRVVPHHQYESVAVFQRGECNDENGENVI